MGPTDANSVVPAQFTADSVVIVDDPDTGRPALVIVVEPQGREEPQPHRPGQIQRLPERFGSELSHVGPARRLAALAQRRERIQRHTRDQRLVAGAA